MASKSLEELLGELSFRELQEEFIETTLFDIADQTDMLAGDPDTTLQTFQLLILAAKPEVEGQTTKSIFEYLLGIEDLATYVEEFLLTQDEIATTDLDN